MRYAYDIEHMLSVPSGLMSDDLGMCLNICHTSAVPWLASQALASQRMLKEQNARLEYRVQHLVKVC